MKAAILLLVMGLSVASRSEPSCVGGMVNSCSEDFDCCPEGQACYVTHMADGYIWYYCGCTSENQDTQCDPGQECNEWGWCQCATDEGCEPNQKCVNVTEIREGTGSKVCGCRDDTACDGFAEQLCNTETGHCECSNDLCEELKPGQICSDFGWCTCIDDSGCGDGQTCYLDTSSKMRIPDNFCGCASHEYCQNEYCDFDTGFCESCVDEFCEPGWACDRWSESCSVCLTNNVCATGQECIDGDCLCASDEGCDQNEACYSGHCYCGNDLYCVNPVEACNTDYGMCECSSELCDPGRACDTSRSPDNCSICVSDEGCDDLNAPFCNLDNGQCVRCVDTACNPGLVCDSPSGSCIVDVFDESDAQMMCCVHREWIIFTALWKFATWYTI